MLELDLAHEFGAFTLDARFTAPPGVTALFGRSGSGKTTVVNAVAGLLRVRRGRVVLAGEVLQDSAARLWLPPHRRRIGYVFQEPRLFPHLTVRQNLEYGAPRDAPPDAFDRITTLLGIAPLLARRPAALSGGEAARVAIGRALLSQPRLLLMDEPLAALDADLKAEILPYLERLRDEAGVPILYVSHAIAEVARLATTVVVIEAGRVLRAGPAAQVLADPEAAPALGADVAGAVLTGRLVAHHPDGLSEVAVSGGTLHLPHVAAAPGSLLRVRIPASEVMLARDRPQGLSALNILPAVVTSIAAAEGAGVMVQLRSGDDLILARITRRSVAALDLGTGSACHIIVKSVAVAPGNIGTDAAGPATGFIQGA